MTKIAEDLHSIKPFIPIHRKDRTAKMGSGMSTHNNGLPTKHGRVIAFHSSSKWNSYFQASKLTSKLVVVKFTASWCGPCHDIQPVFQGFAQIYAADVEFVMIDVDELAGVEKTFGVQSYPTFILLKRGKEVGRVVGADMEELLMMIENHRF